MSTEPCGEHFYAWKKTRDEYLSKTETLFRVNDGRVVATVSYGSYCPENTTAEVHFITTNPNLPDEANLMTCERRTFIDVARAKEYASDWFENKRYLKLVKEKKRG